MSETIDLYIQYIYIDKYIYIYIDNMIPPYSSSYSATKSNIYIYICIYIHMEILYSPCYPHTYATQMHASPRYCSWVARVKTLEAHARGN